MIIDEGPWGVLQALHYGTIQDLMEALDRQREWFHDQFGCFPEELIQTTGFKETT